MRVSAIVLAAGKGKRFKSRISKPLAKIQARPMLVYSLKVLSAHPEIKEIIVAANKNNLKAVVALIKEYRILKVAAVVLGGLRRQDSVACGLRCLHKDTKLVLIHDAARPFIDKRLVSHLIKEAGHWGAAIAGVALKSTLKKAGRDFLVEKTVSRQGLWEIQTPQVFRRDLILKAYSRFGQEDVTDDAMLIEKLGGRVRLVEGSCRNIKITAPEDLEIAAAIAGKGKGKKMQHRIGLGYDIHRLVGGRKLLLGGVLLPYKEGLLGHSDADVLLHAVTDALLGAAGGPDIGELFPDTDSKYRGISSTKLLEKAVVLIKKKGYGINNIDTVVVAEAPRLSPFKKAIRQSLAKILEIPQARVNLKSKTNEGLGSIGKRKAIAAYALVMLTKGD